MRIIIVGAGVVGVTTAYFAAKRGYEVTLLERREEPARETSFANAGQLSYSYTDTLADPGLLRRLPAMLLGRDSGIRILPDPALLSWGLRFLWQCTRARADGNTARLLHLAADSARALEELLNDVAIDFAHLPAGKLMLTSSKRTLEGLKRRAALKRQHGVEVEILGPEACRSVEPVLADWRSPIAGAAYAREDSTGDARIFTLRLCEHLVAKGMCTLVTGVEVQELVTRDDRVVGIRTGQGVHEADAVVICAGVSAKRLLRTAGLAVPIYPLKGYSLTRPPGASAPNVSLTDLDRRIVFARINGHIRLAGLADCMGESRNIDEKRLRDLMRLGREALPAAMHFDASLEGWAGLRPATPSGLPIVGPTKLHGLHLNLGHGALGWTLACGTARSATAQLAQAS